MKKLIAALFLAAALVSPALADGLELIPKIGYLFTPEVTSDGHSSSKDSAVSLGVDLFFDMQNNFFLGAGLVWGQNTAFSDRGADEKIGFMNLYAAMKYKFLVNDSADSPFFLYPLFQLGFGSGNWEYSGNIENYEVQGGLYWGIGVGAEFSNIIVEFIYGCNYGTVKGSHVSEDFSYTAFRFNVGYKFNL